ncbi:MAG TPA: mobile mystery protein A [Candidatus Paceibacterota bacterium]|nr:mobile mystery protein A [Candidatus Paceibacterota bacterium]
MNRESRARDRRTLDNRLKKFPKKEEFTVPRQGWIKSIREALGMSAADLGDRMGIARQSVLTLEESESGGRAGMDSLKRAAEAMDCSFVYAFIPNSSLENVLRKQIEKVVAQRMGNVSHSMKLEDQVTELTDSVYEALVKDLMNSPKVWHSAIPKHRPK